MRQPPDPKTSAKKWKYMRFFSNYILISCYKMCLKSQLAKKTLLIYLYLGLFFYILTFVCRVHVFAKSIKNQMNQVIQISGVFCDSEFRHPHIKLTTDVPHSWITRKGHENKRNDHQPMEFLIVTQILLVYWTVWRRCILMLGCEGLM